MQELAAQSGRPAARVEALERRAGKDSREPAGPVDAGAGKTASGEAAGRAGHHDEVGRRSRSPGSGTRRRSARSAARTWPGRRSSRSAVTPLTRHAQQRVLKISPDWPWKDALPTCWQRLCALPAPT
jgi:hypothetical protein